MNSNSEQRRFRLCIPKQVRAPRAVLRLVFIFAIPGASSPHRRPLIQTRNAAAIQNQKRIAHTSPSASPTGSAVGGAAHGFHIGHGHQVATYGVSIGGSGKFVSSWYPAPLTSLISAMNVRGPASAGS